MKHYPLALLCLAIGRHLIFASNIGDAGVIAALAALYGYSLFLDSKKETPINDAIKADLEQVKSSINSLKIARVSR